MKRRPPKPGTLPDKSPQRRYTVRQLDRMREIIRDLNTPSGSSWGTDELNAAVEDQLRTHMVNGTSVKQLEVAKQEFWDQEVADMKAREADPEWQKQQREWQERFQREHPEFVFDDDGSFTIPEQPAVEISQLEVPQPLGERLKWWEWILPR